MAVTGAGTDKPQDMLDAINRRIDYAREHGARIACKGQNDTVIVRPLVVQLDEKISANIPKHGCGMLFQKPKQCSEKTILSDSLYTGMRRTNIFTLHLFRVWKSRQIMEL